MRSYLVVAFLLIFSTACTPTLSREALVLVDADITFEQLHSNPDSYAGRHVLLGGAIAAARIADGGGELEIVHLPTDQRGRVTDTQRSAGRFIATDEIFRDPAIFQQGRLVTVVGQVVGSRVGRIGEADYRFPLIRVEELHLWPAREPPEAGGVRFGIGLGIGIFR